MTPVRPNKALSASRVPSSVSAGPILRAALCCALGVGVGLLAFGEITHRRSSRRRLGDAPERRLGGGPERRFGHLSEPGRDEIIVVLGYRNPGARANLINRFRVRAGLRSIDQAARSSVVIFCGGAVAGAVPEAEILESFARHELGFTGPALLETASTSTWENITNAIALIDDVRGAAGEPAIKIVSNSHHAEKARAHLWTMRPDLARQLVPAEDYRFGELLLIKPIAAGLGIAALRRLDRA